MERVESRSPVIFPEVSPESVGMSSAALARIREASISGIDRHLHAGTVSLVARHGKIVHFETVGMQDREAAVPMARDTIFRVFSNSKLVTSVAVMMLYEAGRLTLDDPVAKYLPALGNLQVGVEEGEGPARTLKLVPSHRDMTVRDLLSHTGGLSYGWNPNALVDRLYGETGVYVRDLTIAETVEKLGKLPLKHHPGAVWEYSISCDVLGRLVEVVSGQRYDRYLEEKIFQPLAMPDTGFYVPPEKTGRFAADYKINEQGAAYRVAEPDATSRHLNTAWNFLAPPTYFGGGGGLVSTTMDHLHFWQMLLNKGCLGEVRILQPETVELMTRNQLAPETEISELGQGMGVQQGMFGIGFRLMVPPDGKRGWHCSWGGAAGTSVWMDPVNDLLGIYMIQIHNHDASLRFRELVYDAIVDR